MGALHEPLEPAKLVVVFRPRRGIAAWEVQAADDNAVDGCLDVAAMRVIEIRWKTADGFHGDAVAGEDGRY